jgi:S1-C subfamily serine protease
MRVLTAAFIIVVQATILNATDWSTVVAGLDKSVPRIEILDPDSERPGVCSGVVLNAEAGYVLTAAHCVNPNPDKVSITVNGKHAELVRQNRVLDLAVIRAELKGGISMPLAKQAPVMGSEIAVVGFAFGQKKLAVQVGHVSLPLDDDELLILDVVAIGGDSGGPAINPQGELVGLTSAVKVWHPAMHVALTVPVEKVRDFVEHYLPQKP